MRYSTVSRIAVCLCLFALAGTVFAQQEPRRLVCDPASVGAAVGTAEWFASSSQQPGNAATLYYRSLLLIDLAPDENLEFKPEWLETPPQTLPKPDVRRVLENYEVLLREVHHASRRQNCDWDLAENRDGPAILLPELSSLRRIGQLLSLRTRLAMADQDPARISDSLRINLALARHLATGPTQYHVLVGVGIYRLAFDDIELWIQSVRSPNLYHALANLPQPLCDLQPSMQHDQEVFTKMFPALETVSQTPDGERRVELVDEQIDRWVEELEVEGIEKMKNLRAIARAGLVTEAWQRLKKADVPGWKAMTPVQSVMVDAVRQYEGAHRSLSEAMQKPYWEAMPLVKKQYPDYRQVSVKADAALTGGLLGALEFAQGMPELLSAAASVQQRFHALLVIESIRDQMARSSGQLLEKLQPNDSAPWRDDPVSGSPFRVSRRDDVIVIAPAEPEGSPLFELAFAKPGQ